MIFLFDANSNGLTDIESKVCSISLTAISVLCVITPVHDQDIINIEPRFRERHFIFKTENIITGVIFKS